MGKIRSALTVAVILAVACHANGEEAANGKDSYLAALHNSHQINQQNKAHGLVRVPREDYNSVPSSSYDYSLTPSTGYGAPANSYGPPPKAAYGPPKPVYGPPQPVYGPPPPAPTMSVGTPHMSPESWLLNKLKLKFSWFTLAKILLKIVIFKKIVKFLALLCLLFFIPTLKPSESESEHSDDESRRRSYDLQYDYDTRLNHVTTFALKAMEAFTIDNELYCPEENFLGCRAKRMFDVIDEEYPLKEILRMYVPHSSRKVFRLHSNDDDGGSDDQVADNGLDNAASYDDGNSNSSSSDSNESRERDD